MSRLAMQGMQSAASSAIQKQCKISIVSAQRNSHIDWNDYNFPPLLKVIHFRLSDFQGAEKSLIRKLYITWLMLLGVLCVNVISTIVLSASILPGINILYTFLNLVIFSSLGTLVFFLGYYGVAKRQGNYLLWFKILGALAALMYLLISIFPFGAFNGWAKIPVIQDHDDSVVGFGVAMCVIESLVYTVLCALQCWAIYLVQTEAVIFM